MEIYLKIKTEIGTNGSYGGWVEKGLGDVYANQAKYITVEIASHSTSDYYMQVEIWEDDGWGSGNDDLVADVTYNEIRYGYANVAFYHWGYNVSNIPYQNSPIYSDWKIRDGIEGSSDYDVLITRSYQ